MPLELRLRRSDDLLRLAASGRRERAGALDEELSPKTECSEDSVEIRSTPMRIHHRKPQIILRPNAVLASPLHSSSLKRPSSSGSTYPPNKMSNWMDSEQPDEKRMRLMAGQQQQQPPPLTHFYHPASAQHQNVLKLAGQQQHQHPHELLLLEAERNRLFHHWMRPNNWPLPHVHPAAESSAAHHLMTSALHYHYPHLLQQQQQQQQHHHQGYNYNLPPHPFLHPSSPASAAAAAASIFNLSYGHLLPHPIFHHQRPAAFFSTPPSGGIGKTLPPLSPICARSVTPPPSILGPLPPLIPVGGSQSPRHIEQPPLPPPDFNHKKIPNTSGESFSPSATSLTIGGKKTNKKSAIHPAGRTSQATKESRKHPSDSGSDRKFSSKTADVVVAVKPPVLPLFLSVETLLSREKPAAPAEKIRPEERFRHAESEEEEEMEEEEMHWRSSSSAFRDGPDGFQPSAASGGASMAGSASHRNYKNMTRERRMQANARERTRVHTISSAFEALRRAVPSFSHGQRLSKLSILRVASAYIAALGQLAGDEDSTQESSAQITRDEEKDHQTTTTTTTGRRQLAECVDRCTRTLMTEGQLLRRNRKRSGVANGRQPSDDEDD